MILALLINLSLIFNLWNLLSLSPIVLIENINIACFYVSWKGFRAREARIHREGALVSRDKLNYSAITSFRSGEIYEDESTTRPGWLNYDTNYPTMRRDNKSCIMRHTEIHINFPRTATFRPSSKLSTWLPRIQRMFRPVERRSM